MSRQPHDPDVGRARRLEGRREGPSPRGQELAVVVDPEYVLRAATKRGEPVKSTVGEANVSLRIALSSQRIGGRWAYG